MGGRAGARCGALVVVLVVVAVLLVPTAVSAGGPTGLTVETVELSLPAGEPFTVTGSGCPPEGELPGGPPMWVVLAPPGMGTVWYPNLVDGEVVFAIPTARIPGHEMVAATPAEDGTFEVVVPIPTDAPGGGPYSVTVYCTGLLVADEEGTGFTPESLAAWQRPAGTVHVVPVVVDPPYDPPPVAPPPVVPPPVRTAPAFTG